MHAIKALFLSAVIVLTGCAENAQEAVDENSAEAKFAKELEALGFASAQALEINERTEASEQLVVVDDIVYYAGGAALMPQGAWLTGIVRGETDVANALIAAKISCVRAINHLHEAVGGDFGKIRKIANIRYYVASSPAFTEQSNLANGCSDMMVRVFGEEVGAHTRSVMGVNALGGDLTVKFDLIAYIDSE